MQMHSVETNAGTAICCAPSRMALMIGFRCPMLRWMFSISTVASSTRMPTASASPPSVITLIVSPSRFITASDVRMESGMEMQTMMVQRQLPRNSRIMSAGEERRDGGFLEHPVDGRAHEDGLIEQQLQIQRGRQRGADARQNLLDLGRRWRAWKSRRSSARSTAWRGFRCGARYSIGWRTPSRTWPMSRR